MLQHALDDRDLSYLLCRHGFLDRAHEHCAAAVERALRDYQAYHQLDVDGWAGPVTRESLEAPRFCALPDRLEVDGDICRWAKTELLYAIESAPAGLDPATYEQATTLALGFWAEVCGLKFRPHANARTADVVMRAGRIDGPSGTLAWSKLPCGNFRVPLDQMYDHERWVVSETQADGIDIVRVLCHEWGHMLGMGHTDTPRQLMNPRYSWAIRRPQAAWDIPESVKRYPRESGPTTPPPTGESELVYDLPLPAGRTVQRIQVRVS